MQIKLFARAIAIVLFAMPLFFPNNRIKISERALQARGIQIARCVKWIPRMNDNDDDEEEEEERRSE